MDNNEFSQQIMGFERVAYEEWVERVPLTHKDGVTAPFRQWLERNPTSQLQSMKLTLGRLDGKNYVRIYRGQTVSAFER